MAVDKTWEPKAITLNGETFYIEKPPVCERLYPADSKDPEILEYRPYLLSHEDGTYDDYVERTHEIRLIGAELTIILRLPLDKNIPFIPDIIETERHEHGVWMLREKPHKLGTGCHLKIREVEAGGHRTATKDIVMISGKAGGKPGTVRHDNHRPCLWALLAEGIMGTPIISAQIVCPHFL